MVYEAQPPIAGEAATTKMARSEASACAVVNQIEAKLL